MGNEKKHERIPYIGFTHVRKVATEEMNPASEVTSYKFQQPITFFIFRILKKSIFC